MLVQHENRDAYVPKICKQILCALVLCLITCAAHSQAVPVTTAYPKNPPVVPSWVTMMDDPNVNYYDAVKAFNDYWKNKIKPVEEDELDESPSDKDPRYTRRQLRAMEREKEREEKLRRKLTPNDPAIKYAFEYKRFLHWQLEMEPHVKDDGHIKTMDERIGEWEKHKAARKAQEHKTGKGPNSPKQ